MALFYNVAVTTEYRQLTRSGVPASVSLMETPNTLKEDLGYTRKGRDAPQHTRREQPPAAPHMRGERQEVEPHLASRDREDGEKRGREIQERWGKAHNSWLHGRDEHCARGARVECHGRHGRSTQQFREGQTEGGITVTTDAAATMATHEGHP